MKDLIIASFFKSFLKRIKMISKIVLIWVIATLALFLELVAAQVSVSEAEFQNAVKSNQFPSPSKEQYKGFQNSLQAGAISSKMEAAMFLAQILHESGGFVYKREKDCSGANGCPNKYPESGEWREECKGAARPKGQSYYGRGYIQLTWCSNYVQASAALGKGDSLKKNPDSVANSESLSWGVSAWYWKINVHGALGGSNQFGRTTKAINGQKEECHGANRDKSERRFGYYKNVFKAFKLSGTPNESGCYN